MNFGTGIKLLFLMPIFFSCQDRSITGHWHIHAADFLNVDYMTLDILEDSIAILNRYASDGGVSGRYSISKKEIMFPGECGAGRFKYTWDWDDLNLENDLQVKRRAIKCSSLSCDLYKDLLIESKLQVSLPEVVVNRDCLTYRLDDSYAQNIIVGKLKPVYPSCYVSNRRLELGGKLGAIEDIQIWMDSVASKYPEGKQNRISYAIFGDKDLPVIELEMIVEELLKSGAKRIFVATLNPDFRRSNSIFEYVAIHDVNLKSGLTLGELLY